MTLGMGKVGNLTNIESWQLNRCYIQSNYALGLMVSLIECMFMFYLDEPIKYMYSRAVSFWS